MLKFLEKYDLKILEYINLNFRNKLLDKIMKWFTALGNLGLVWLILSAFFIAKRNLREKGIMVFTALALTTIVGEGIIKHIVKRKRPFVKMDNADSLLIKIPITYSFPSGHTASSFAVASVFINTDSRISIIILIIATMIALSRIYLNVHYPSDVIGGGIIGFICGAIVVFLFTGGIS